MLKKLQRKIVFMNMLLVGIVLLAVLAVFCYNESRLERAMINDDLMRSVNFLQQKPFRDFREMFPLEGSFGDLDDDLYDDDLDDDDAADVNQDNDVANSDDIDENHSAGWYLQIDGGQPAPNGNDAFPGDMQSGDGTSQGNMQSDDGTFQGSMPGADRAIPDNILAVKVDESGSVYEFYDNDSDMSEDDMNSAVSYVMNHKSETLAENTEDEYFYICVENDGTAFMAFTDAEDYHDEVRDTILKSGVLWLVIMFFFFLISMFMARIAVRPVKESWDRQQEFVADASHELKTPLTVILANNNILLSPDRDLADDDRKWVESNQEEATHMKALVDQLLFLARSDSDDQKMLLSDLDLGDMIMGDVLQFEPVAFERGIMIDPELDPDVHIAGDSTMIKQLIHILLDNACKYAAENGTIHVTLKKERQGCTLSVQNPGRPIPPEDLPHIFERFYRADKARTYQENASGYGLGLAIAQSIAQDHKGTISCTSNAEDGTTFTVRFRERLR